MAKHDAKRMPALLAGKDRRGLTFEELSEETAIPVSTLGYWRRSGAINRVQERAREHRGR